MSTDPRKAQGSISGGGPYERGAAIIDATNAVVLDHITSCIVEPFSTGIPQPAAIAFSMRGRINRTTEQSEIVYIFDAEAAASICADLIGLMNRAGNADFPAMLEAALRRQP